MSDDLRRFHRTRRAYQRDSADWRITWNPTRKLPAPIYSTVHAFPPRGDWAEMCAEIDAIAAFLGVAPGMTGGGHYVAVRSFGPVEYRAVAIPPGSDRERVRQCPRLSSWPAWGSWPFRRP